MALFATETDVVEIADDGKTYHVTIRKMNEGDRCDRINLISRKGTVDGILGTLEEFDLVRSITEWDFPKPLSVDAIRDLDPDVALAVHDGIKALNPSIWTVNRPTEASTATTTTK